MTVIDGQTLTLGQSGASALLLSPHGTAGNELASLINTAGTTDGSDAAGSILLSAVAGGIGLAWADDKDLWMEGGQAIVTANHDAAGAIKLHADAGTSQTILVQNDAGTTDGSDGAGSVLLAADAGGIGLAWADDKDLWAEGGQIMMVANHDAANAIKLHADAGTSQTIHIVNDAGTSATEGAAAIQLLASAGGINIKGNKDAANAILLTADGGTSATINVHNDQGTGASSVALTSDAGGIKLTSGLDGAASVHLAGFGITLTGGDEDDSVYIENSPIKFEQISAPSTTTDKLYNVAGALYFNGRQVAAESKIVMIVSASHDQNNPLIILDGATTLSHDSGAGGHGTLDIFVNGQLMTSGSVPGATTYLTALTDDYYIGDAVGGGAGQKANGASQVTFKFPLEQGDIITAYDKA